MGRVQHQRQEYRSAIAYAQQAVQLYKKAGVLNGLATAHIVLGYAALAVNDLPLALSNFPSALDLAIEKDRDRTYVALVGLAEIAHRQEKPALAARIFGVAERFAQRLNPFYDRWKEVYCRPLLTAAHTQLRDGAYATAWAEGQTMPLEQAMQLALTFADSASAVILPTAPGATILVCTPTVQVIAGLTPGSLERCQAMEDECR